mgnify:FL=1
MEFIIEKIVCFLLAALDIFPLAILLYKPFKSNMGASYKKAMALMGLGFMLYDVMFAFLFTQPFYPDSIMGCFRFSQLAVLAALTAILTKERFSRLIYIFTYLYSLGFAILTASVITEQLIYPLFTEIRVQPYLIMTIARIILTACFYRAADKTVSNTLTPNLKIEDDDTWNYLCIFNVLFMIVLLFVSTSTLSLDEPKFSALFGSAALFFTVTLINTMFFSFSKELKAKTEAAVKAENEKKISELLKSRYELMSEGIKETRHLKEDVKKCFNKLKTYIDNENYSEAKSEFQHYLNNYSSSRKAMLCENFTADAILRYYKRKAIEAGIDVSISFRLEDDALIPDAELCTFIGSCMENAIEGCMTAPEDERFIKIGTLQAGNYFYVVFDNSFDGELHKQGDDENSPYLSRKSGFTVPGLGMKAIAGVVNRCGGQMKIETENNVFSLSASLRSK